jgi:heptosyltransferase III
LRGGAIGDFILTLPVLAALRRHYPQSRIELLGYPHIAQLAQAGGLVDEIRALESPSLTGLFHPDGILDANWIEYFRGVQLILSYLYDPEGILANNLARLCPARQLQGRHRPGESQNQHAVDTWLEPLAELGIHHVPREPVLKLADTERDHLEPQAGIKSLRGRALLAKRWLALHPGSGSEKKNWPETLWAALLRKLWSETHWHTLLVGGEAEGGRLDRLCQQAPADRIRLAQNLPLLELAHWMLPCSGFIGHDSGITHLAAALGLPGVVLWGPSNSQIWRPLSRKMTLLKAHEEFSNLTVPQVFTAIQRQLRE